jgi:hypothetical protein
LKSISKIIGLLELETRETAFKVHANVGPLA